MPNSALGQNNSNNLDPRVLGRIGDPIDNDYMNVRKMDNVDNVAVEPNLASVQPISPSMTSGGKKKNPLNKVLFVVLILMLIGCVGFGVYYYLNLGTQNAGTSAGLITKELTMNKNGELPTDLTEYAQFNTEVAANCLLNVDDVDVTVAGEYQYKITCGANEYTGKIIVVDKELPTVETQKLTVITASEISAEDFVISCSKENCTYAFEDEAKVTEYLSTTSGTYDVVITITDEAGNVGKETVTLVVTPEKVYAYLEASTASSADDNYDASKVMTDKFAIGNGNLFIGVASRTYVYTFTSDEEYTKVKEEITTNNDNTFDGLTGEISFDDEKKEVILEVSLEKETLDLEYSGSFPTTYTEIKNYYETKGYTTKISNA